MFNNRKKVILAALGSIVLIILAWMMFGGGNEEESLIYTVKKGELVISVTTSGELEAKNSVPIMGPSNLRKLRIWQIKIDDLIEEGTIVKKGEYVGALSKSEVLDKLQEEESQLLKTESQAIQTRLDTTIDLSQARNEIKNIQYNVKEKEIVLEQSKYEPPATIRQAKNDLDKTKKSLIDLQKNYELKVQKGEAQMNEVLINHQLAQRKIEQIQATLSELTITAPENGMVIYKRDWDGKKYQVGSMIGTWSPVVATLPDLSIMLSKTYVNEVDVSKIKVGQKVLVSLDAFPEKNLTGEVKSVSNIGQQNPNSDGKVFEVTVLIDDKDDELRPSMTTGNQIIQETKKEVLLVPLEGIHSLGDSINYVLVKSGFGIAKQQVTLGSSNTDFCEIIQGLEQESEILLSIPEDMESLQLIPLEDSAN